jgi:hypothetical protein
MKNFLTRILLFISSIWANASKEVRQIAPIAIGAVNALKTVNESFAGDIIAALIGKVIPGNADDIAIQILRQKLKQILPKVILQLNIANYISKISDPNEQLKAILVEINCSSDETKNMYYHGLSALILQSLADGKLSWSESVQISEYYYVNIHKK